MHGYGTIAGLAATFDAAEDEIRIAPGLAIDPLGRLIEVSTQHCLNAARWYTLAAEDADTADHLTQAFQAGTGTSPDHVRAHVFLSFRQCEQGKTPAFRTGNFDALDAVAPSRMLDTFELKLLIGTRDQLTIPAPHDPGPAQGDLASRLSELDRFKVEDAWREPPDAVEGEQRLEISPALLLPGQETTDVLLASVVIPAQDGAPPQRNTAIDITINSQQRPFSYSTAELFWLASNEG